MADKQRILVVDDNPSNLRLAKNAIADLGLEVETADDGMQALEMVKTNPPDLLLVDVVMPKMNGLELCRMVKSIHSELFLPIILVTAKDDIESKITGIKLGADDYLTKPYNPLELQARISAMLRIKSLQDKISDKRQELEALSVIDTLTGLYNHKAMQQRLRDEFMRAQRYNEPLSVLMIDIDNFKEINELYGHEFGDYILGEFAKLLKTSLREIDIAARYGGEEFLAILPQTHFTGSLTVADRVWRNVAAATFKNERHSHRLTTSIGIAFYPNKAIDSVERLLTFAEEALHQAKSEGRNRICLHQHLSYMYRPDAGAD